ncbi:protein kinase [Streptomyces sp. NPDC051207]|uniref:serine/threonine-protein kinase n=1 Tax=Streptomyces sp. NPDC051207 TaxID=3154641 RepID=UPI003417BFB7
MLLADRYQLDELLGRGSMGEVWRATDQLLGRRVAVKLLRTEEATDTERFRLEALTAARLNHPHVVGVYDFGSDRDRLFLVMEYIDGWSLAEERSLRGVLPPQEAAALAAQVAAGLSAAHRHGVIHRDIKPANIMLTTDRTAKITDFGIARFADEADRTLTATDKIVGTADYLAPERALGRSADPASDIYSLGCVLYQLLTGRALFQGATSLAVVQQHVDAVPVPPDRVRPGIPQPLSDYVLRLLAKDPAQRPTADDVADWLNARQWEGSPAEPVGAAAAAPPPPAATASLPLGSASAPPAVPPSPSPSHSRPRSRGVLASKAVLGGTAVVLFAGAAAVGASLNSGDDTPVPPASPARTTVTTVTATGLPSATPSSPTPSSATPSSATPSSATPSSATPPSATPTPAFRGEDRQEDDKDRAREGKHGKGKGKGKKKH